MNNIREQIKDKKRIVVKIGSSSLQHAETGDLDYIRLEKLVRELCDISNQGKEVVLVTSGAIAAGKQAVHLKTTEGQTQAESMAIKQACSAIGQARLMMTYQKLFAEYNQVAAQILMTKNTIVDNLNRYNAHNTFTQLLKIGAIPVVTQILPHYHLRNSVPSDTALHNQLLNSFHYRSCLRFPDNWCIHSNLQAVRPCH